MRLHTRHALSLFTAFASLVLLSAGCSDEPSTLDCPAGKTCAFTSISAGYEHTCAIYSVVEGAADDYGQVVCWGENRDGRCGAGTGFGESQARQSMVVAELNDAKSIVAGGTQTCAQRKNGKVVCWGGNSFGELGNGEEDGSFVPVEVKWGVTGDVEQVAAGGTSAGGTTCARTDDNKVWCWGRNHERQVRPGVGDTQDRPVQIQNLAAPSDIAVGQDFACAINDRALQCWGSRFGSAPSTLTLANASETTTLSAKGFMACAQTPDAVTCFTKPDDFVTTPIANTLQVSTGSAHTCALRDTGKVVCWGGPGNRLGIGNDIPANNPTNELFPQEEVQLSNSGEAVVQIASGASHSCALDSLGDIYCWGDNSQGQLGDGGETSRSVPILLQLPL